MIVAVPRRSDGGHRDHVWSWIENRWRREHPGWNVVEGVHEKHEGPFNRSTAINRAAAGEWDVMVIADADSFVSAEQATAAAGLAHRTGQVTFAYDRFAYLNKRMSDMVLDGYTGDWWPGVEWTMTGTCSSMVAVPRGPWDECGGADEGFDSGWGGEDIAISHMLQTFGGGMHRIHGDVWHLHHPVAPRTHEGWPDRIERYGKASYDKPAMVALINELRVEQGLELLPTIK